MYIQQYNNSSSNTAALSYIYTCSIYYASLVCLRVSVLVRSCHLSALVSQGVPLSSSLSMSLPKLNDHMYLPQSLSLLYGCMYNNLLRHFAASIDRDVSACQLSKKISKSCILLLVCSTLLISSILLCVTQQLRFMRSAYMLLCRKLGVQRRRK